ncbi:hypothetical protein Tco_1538596 [Tanacetum coccineum]
MNGWILEDDEEEEEEEDPEMEEEVEEENDDDDDAEFVLLLMIYEKEAEADIVGTSLAVPYSVAPILGSLSMWCGPSRQVYALAYRKGCQHFTLARSWALSQQMFDGLTLNTQPLKRLRLMDNIWQYLELDCKIVKLRVIIALGGMCVHW